MPFIQEQLTETFGHKLVQQPQVESAIGALVWASYLAWNQNENEQLPIDDLKIPGAMDRLVPPKLSDSFQHWSVTRSTAESIGVLTETAEGARKLELVPFGMNIPTVISRQVGVTGPGIVSRGVLPRRGDDIVLTILGGAEDPRECDLLAELTVNDPNEIASQLQIDLRFMDYDGSFIIDVIDPVNSNLLISQEIHTDQRRGLMGESLVDRWRKDLRVVTDKGPGHLEELLS
jgi:hypothetical protein